MKIKFIADIHISPLTVTELQRFGYDIQRITEFLRASASDSEIINLSIRQNAVIITQDLDFSNLIVKHGLSKPSIISLRMEKPIPSLITKILHQLLPKIEKELLKGALFLLMKLISGLKYYRLINKIILSIYKHHAFETLEKIKSKNNF